MTETEFINREIDTWGEAYITDLLDKGYRTVETTEGWRWFLSAVPVQHRVLQTLAT